MLPPGRAPEPPPPPRVPGRSISAAPLRPAPQPEPGRPAPRPAAERPPVERTAPERREAAARSASAEQAPRRRRRERVEVPDERLVYLSVGEAVRRSGASASSVRAWVRTGQVRTRTGKGARGERLEVALGDVEAVLARRAAASPAQEPAVRRAPAAGEQPTRAIALPAGPSPEQGSAPDVEDERPAARAPQPARRRRRTQDEAATRREEDGVNPDAQLVPMTTVEAMERLSGELYLAGQRAARAEAVAELRERRLADLQQEVEDLQREATALWEQNQELLRRVALAEAQLEARSNGAAAAPAEPLRWRLRR